MVSLYTWTMCTQYKGVKSFVYLRGSISTRPYHWVGAKVHVTRCVDLYSGQILVFSMTLMTVCVLSAV